MVTARQGEVSIYIEATADSIWQLLTDVERMGKWSPECYRVEWLDGAHAPARLGARFKGWNQYQNRFRMMRWSVSCEITSAEPSREVAWTTILRGRPGVRWTYRLVPSNGGTDVTESFEVLHLPPLARFAEDHWMRDRDERRQQAMQQTLERIKTVAEAGQVPKPGVGGSEGKG